MVKGVSKTVIVVNNTGSKLFEKIVFYVTPEYGNLSAKQLKKAAGNFSFNYDDTHPYGRLRRQAKKRRIIKASLISAAVLAAAVIALILIL